MSIIEQFLIPLGQNSKEGSDTLSREALKAALKTTHPQIEEINFNSLFEANTGDADQFTPLECKKVYLTFSDEAKNIQNHFFNGMFMFNSILRMSDRKIIKSNIYDGSTDPNRFDVKSQFKQFLGESFHDKLLKYGSLGLLNEKHDGTKVEKYMYYHWVERYVPMQPHPCDILPLQLLKFVWNFDFQAAAKLADDIMSKVINETVADTEIIAVQLGLKNLRNMQQKIIENEELKEHFQQRSVFQLQLPSGQIERNHPELHEFSKRILQIKQILDYSADYFRMLANTLTNPYYRALAIFLSNKQPDFSATNSKIMAIEAISIAERCLYARKFYRDTQFLAFRNKMFEDCANFREADYVLLFGSRKQSEVILQNYLNESSNIQRVAVISLYLKRFAEQSKLALRENKSLFAYFVRTLDFLLVRSDDGISKHQFDQKSLKIQSELRPETVNENTQINKTFTFCCSNCKSSQCFSSLKKRASLQLNQPRMKGFHYFAKDVKSQVIHCIECMVMLPRCCICLYPIAVFNPYTDNLIAGGIQGKEGLDNTLVWCPQCFHGGHLSHMFEWFQKNGKVCPVAGCTCKCEI